MAQGYFISPPLPCAEFDRWLAARDGAANEDTTGEATAA